jgi:hypothetical protein
MRRWLVVAAIALAVAAAACGGGSSDGSGGRFPEVISLGEGEIFPVINNRTLGVGSNRFSLGLLDKENQPVLEAEVHLAFYDLGDGAETLKSEADARFIPLELSFVDEQSGRQTRVVGSNGVYVAQVSFGRAGAWGVEVSVTRDGEELEPVPFRFDVFEKTLEPQIGETAPPTVQPVLSDVEDIAQIDSSYPPRPEMHGITVAQALALRKPVVLAFATPAFCESRTCAPVMDTVMDTLYAKYKEQATFIHIEPYSLELLRAGTARVAIEATADWGLRTEPWVFVVDGGGTVVAKFEGIMALDEVEDALKAALGSGA